MITPYPEYLNELTASAESARNYAGQCSGEYSGVRSAADMLYGRFERIYDAFP